MPNKSFTTAVRSADDPVWFEVDGERFDCSPVAPGAAILDVATLSASEDAQDRIRAIPTFLDSVLMPESRARFAARMGNPERPITVDTCGAVIAYLLEVYTGRPPAEPSPSL